MEKFVARQNITHYREMLKITADPAQRRQIEELLLAEEAKLKKYEDDQVRSSPPNFGSRNGA